MLLSWGDCYKARVMSVRGHVTRGARCLERLRSTVSSLQGQFKGGSSRKWGDRSLLCEWGQVSWG